MLAQGIYHTRETARRLLEIYTEGRDWFYFITLLCLVLIQYGPVAAGQLAIPFFVLHTLSQISLFGLHGHLRQSFRMSDDPAGTIWSRAIRARITLLLITIPILLLAGHSSLFITYSAIWLSGRFFNEVLLAGARLQQKINEWVLLRSLILVAFIVYYLTNDIFFSGDQLLKTMAIGELVMFIFLLAARISKFRPAILPTFDITQLQQALPHFYAQLLFTYNYYYLMVPIAFLLPLLATGTIYIQLLILSLGLVPAYIIWNDYRTGRPRMNESELTAATLALGIRGTVISFFIVTGGIFLTEACEGDIAGMSVVLPQFIILLTHYYTIPTLHALTEEGRIHALIRLWFGFIALQLLAAYFILQGEHPNMLFPVIAMIALAQSMAVFLLRNLKYEHE